VPVLLPTLLPPFPAALLIGRGFRIKSKRQGHEQDARHAGEHTAACDPAGQGSGQGIEGGIIH
jgi:hypothetical protein